MKVSVLMTTYNHQEFIEEAIESVLMQNTNFEYELVIGEDCSTDHTRNIVKKYQEKYPDIIKLNLQEKNSGGNRNFIDTLNTCQGEYIALLEGDDYWTDKNKLQKQVDFLDNNPDCTLCGHGYKRYYEETKEFFGDIVYEVQKFTLEDLLKEDILNRANKFHIRTLTRMFRKTTLTNALKSLEDIILWDYVIEVLLLMDGYGAYLEENMGVYRINKNSSVQKHMAIFSEMLISMRREVLKIIPPQYRVYVIESIENKSIKKEYYEFTDSFKSDSCNNEVIDYFTKNNFRRIIIYGAGTLARLLDNKLQGSNIEVLYFVEGRNQPDEEKNIFGLEQLQMKLADAIVVTPFFDFDNIRNQLLNLKLDTEIISLKEVL